VNDTTAHYITCNGNVEVVVTGTREFAKGVMRRLIKDHRMFKMPDYWNLRSVPIISELEGDDAE
jgi:hypothetical protein